MEARIVFVLGFLPDPRMEVRMEAVCGFGPVTALCWDRGEAMVPVAGGSTPWRLVAFRHPGFGLSLRRVRAFSGFAVDVWNRLEKLEPDVIHFQGLDVACVVFAYRATASLRRGRIKPSVVMEVADVHPLLFSRQKTAWRCLVSRALSGLEGAFVRRSELLVLTSRRHWQDRYRRFTPLQRTLFLPNVAGALQLKGMSVRPPSGSLKVGYFGVIRHKESVRMLVDAAKAAGIGVVIAGVEPGGNEIERYCRAQEHVTWKGPFRLEDLPQLYAGVDLVYSVYDVSRENVRQSLTNKLFEGVFALRPVIVPAGTYMAEVVEGKQAGFTVKSNDEAQLAALFERLAVNPESLAACQQGCLAYRNELLSDDAVGEYRRRIGELLAQTRK